MPGIINQLGLGQYLNAANMARLLRLSRLPLKMMFPILSKTSRMSARNKRSRFMLISISDMVILCLYKQMIKD